MSDGFFSKCAFYLVLTAITFLLCTVSRHARGETLDKSLLSVLGDDLIIVCQTIVRAGGSGGGGGGGVATVPPPRPSYRPCRPYRIDAPAPRFN